jgi:hypothetical protein
MALSIIFLGLAMWALFVIIQNKKIDIMNGQQIAILEDLQCILQSVNYKYEDILAGVNQQIATIHGTMQKFEALFTEHEKSHQIAVNDINSLSDAMEGIWREIDLLQKQVEFLEKGEIYDPKV